MLEAVLHTICFLRLLGPLRPATAHVLGVETVRVLRVKQPLTRSHASRMRVCAR